jgi:hypothetical protein
VIQHLHHDGPERRALLKAAGLGSDALSARQCAAVARGLMRTIEEDYPGRECVLWAALPYPDRKAGPPEEGLNTRRLSGVAQSEVCWAWPGRIPLAKLTMICGDPEAGKTWLILDVISRLTTGRAFPDGARPPWGPCDCLFVTAEDGLADTIRPRVQAMGGDPSRVHVLDFVQEGDPKTGRQAALELGRHMDLLDDYLARHPMIRLVGLDPLSAFLGRVDSHRNSEVRGVLGPLAKLAERRGPAVVGINHLTKGEGPALYRGMGSIGFNAAARAVWQVSKDKDDPARRLFLLVKMNIAPDPGGLAFEISPRGLSWGKGRVDTTADEAARPPDRDAGTSARAEARGWLRDLLKDGPVPASDVWAKAKADGLCVKTVKAAKRELGVESDTTGGTGAPWTWALSKVRG